MKGKEGKERWDWLLLSNDMIPHPLSLSLSLLLLLHSNQPQTCILGWHLQQQFVCFFYICVSQLVWTGSICRTHLESHLCQSQSIMNLTQKTQWSQQRVRPGKPASQPGRCEMSSLFIHHIKHNFKLMLCRWPPLSVCLSVHPSIRPGKTVLARCGCANMYELDSHSIKKTCLVS